MERYRTLTSLLRNATEQNKDYDKIVSVLPINIVLLNHWIILWPDLEDKWLERLSNSGIYSVNIAYSYLRNEHAHQASMELNHAWLHSRVQFFIWTLFNLNIPSKVMLYKSNVQVSQICNRCSQNDNEDIDHIFSTCSDTNYLWLTLSNISGINTGYCFVNKLMWNMFVYDVRNQW